jgi:hypothetical protein
VVAAAAAASTLEPRKRGIRADLRPGSRSFNQFLRQRTTPRRKPPETGLMTPVVPPRGPLPLQGGAAAPVDYEG